MESTLEAVLYKDVHSYTTRRENLLHAIIHVGLTPQGHQ